MYLTTLIGLAAGLATHAVNAACSGPLQIDDFSKWSSNQNSLGTWTSGSCFFCPKKQIHAFPNYHR